MDGTRPRLNRIVRDNPIRCVDVEAGTERSCDVLEGLAREIGNLLTVISGWVQYWEEAGALAPDDAPAARYLYIGVGRIRYSLNRLAYRAGKASSDIVEMTPQRLAHGGANNLAVVSINRLVENTLSAVDPRVASGYDLKTVFEPEPWPVIGDFWALDIVLVNLLMDVVATNVPGTTIVIETANLETRETLTGVGGSLAPGRYVTISVRDVHGPRIDGEFADMPELAMGRQSAQGGLPVCLGVLHEHAGLLQMRRSPQGKMTSVMILPALERSNGTSGSALAIGNKEA
jgi:hypothetical protein